MIEIRGRDAVAERAIGRSLRRQNHCEICAAPLIGWLKISGRVEAGREYGGLAIDHRQLARRRRGRIIELEALIPHRAADEGGARLSYDRALVMCRDEDVVDAVAIEICD